MCGDSIQGLATEVTVGHLETFNYPGDYFPNTQCTCRLETIDPSAHIVLYLLDLRLNSDDCSGSDTDWIEYMTTEQNWGHGVKLCGQIRGEPIDTNGNKVYINFRSDEEIQGRGAWLKYLGENGNEVGQYQCYQS